MKKFRRILINIVAVLMMAVCCFSFTACEDIKTLQVNLNVYNTTTQSMEEKTLTVDLYRHLAPNTVDAIVEYVNEGYYNDTFMYIDEENSSQIMLGDLKFTQDKKIVQNLDATGKLKNAINGDFEMNNVKGSNLTNAEGSIGLWRDWYNKGTKYKTSDGARDSGRATWFLPTADLSSNYDGWFCVFGQFDVSEGSDSKAVWESIKTLLNDANNYETYSIYYTGEYTNDASALNNGLTFNCVLSSDYSEVDESTVFEPEGKHYYGYAKHNVRVPMANKGNKQNKAVAVSISSITVK